MKRINILIATLFVASNLTAQTTLDFSPTMFDNLAASKLSTNILADKAGLPKIISGFDGSSSCEASNTGSWLYSYRTLYVGDTGTPTIPACTSTPLLPMGGWWILIGWC